MSLWEGGVYLLVDCDTTIAYNEVLLCHNALSNKDNGCVKVVLICDF